MKKNNIRRIAFMILLLGTDLVSKYVFYNLRIGKQIPIITPVLNTGISRSLPLPYIFIMLVSIIGTIAIIRIYSIKKINRLIAGMLLSGTLGNLIDRFMYGGVRDFINIQLFNFPIFNLADILLTVGVGIRILQVILEKKK